MQERPYCTLVRMRLKRALGHRNPFHSLAQLFFLFLFCVCGKHPCVTFYSLRIPKDPRPLKSKREGGRAESTHLMLLVITAEREGGRDCVVFRRRRRDMSQEGLALALSLLLRLHR
jgi:hypothetical protein